MHDNETKRDARQAERDAGFRLARIAHWSLNDSGYTKAKIATDVCEIAYKLLPRELYEQAIGDAGKDPARRAHVEALAAAERERDLLAETAQRLTAELDGERRAAAAAARDLETFGAALRPIVGLWYKYERLWNAGHVPAMQKAMAAARDLIGEGQP